MIIKKTTYLLVIACMMMVFMVYFIANEVRVTKDEINATQEKLSRYDEDLKVLELEWSYLNTPQRLTSLATKIHRDMGSPSNLQYTDLKNLPTRELITAKADSLQVMP